MAYLPFEIKENICKHLSPLELKPLRLSFKAFAKASEPYLINRFILTRNPKRVAALRQVCHHEVFSEHLTTVVLDTSVLEPSADFKLWCRITNNEFKWPSWDEHRPKASEVVVGKRHTAQITRMNHLALIRYRAVCKDAEAREKDLRIKWQAYQDLVQYQQSNDPDHDPYEAINQALDQCPRLKHVIIADSHPQGVKTTVDRATDPLHKKFRHGTDDDTKHNLAKILPKLVSLRLGGVNAFYVRPLPETTYPNLKHLRMIFRMCKPLGVYRWATCLETLTLSAHGRFIPFQLPYIRSDRLCVLRLHAWMVYEDDLVQLLYRHSHTLQRLHLSDGEIYGGSWVSFLSRISCRLPKLARLRLRNMKSHRVSWQRISVISKHEVRAQKYVLFGGNPPALTWEKTWTGMPRPPPRGVTINHSVEDLSEDLPSGLWQDYEELAYGCTRWDPEILASKVEDQKDFEDYGDDDSDETTGSHNGDAQEDEEGEEEEDEEEEEEEANDAQQE